MVIIIVSVLVCLALVFGGFMLFMKQQMSKLPALSFKETLEYTTSGKNEAVISVGVIKDGVATYKVCGENGKELVDELHSYEIGFLTKNITAALVNKAIGEGKLSLSSTIDTYLDLPERNSYPTIEKLRKRINGILDYTMYKSLK